MTPDTATAPPEPAPRIAIVMGSRSDWETMRHASQTLDELGIAHHVEVVSAHRTPDRLFEFAAGAAAAGLLGIIAGAGGAAHLPGMLAAKTTVPVYGVPVQSAALSGMDSLLSIVQMPAGVPVATFAIGRAGAVNAALFAAQALAARLDDADTAKGIASRLQARRDAQALAVRRDHDPRREPQADAFPASSASAEPSGPPPAGRP
jgi:5-(carboxyamino)imidazole ribonucleotide mutase